ncbi:uncharacterized protein N7459_007263 [Penicillium hispanicum]|uniref:uncharacterized protein n=1 Tax=Penicillium hispanicum TaxID=1080232 RepID=UPI0025423A6B|nr:uncharacterized protein N7459_007263 [Penicillium hispanicum]KAJ5578299.1 hypothetical protein N7459_007263 [Penicillium hispanicum]
MTQTIQQILSDQPNMAGTQPVQYVETVEAYDKWAKVYDTDGNFLQRLDTLEMRALLPRFLDRVSSRFQLQSQSTNATTLVDLGCGTGRNTIQLLEAISQRSRSQDDTLPAHGLQIVGLDASPGMLEVARTAVQSAIEHGDFKNTVDFSLGVFDLRGSASTRSQLSPLPQSFAAAGVISTLVLEHVPLKEFFEAASAIMMPGAYLLVTNMHADMGMRSQAGFTDPQTGVKIRPTSYCHSIPDVLAAADQAGFEIEDLVGEEENNGVLVRYVDERQVGVLGARANKWVGINVWFGLCLSKKA